MKKITFLFALLLILGGCNPYTLINSEVYNDANLAAFKTFRIVTPDEGKLPPRMNMIDYYNIANAIRTQMVERGYTEVASSSLMINFGITVQTEIETQPALPPGYQYGLMPYNGFYPSFIYPRSLYFQNYYSNAKLITGIYKEGVLTMDIINLNDKQFVYSSSVSTILDQGQGALRNVKEIDQAVQVLFSRFPVKPLIATK